MALPVGSSSDAVLALAERLAHRPPRELILALPVGPGGDLTQAARALNERRDGLQTRGIAARAAAFTAHTLGADLVRMATEQDVDLLLVQAERTELSEPTIAAILADAPCDVALLVGRESDLAPGPVLVPFSGAEHDWTAIEIAAWIAGSEGAPYDLRARQETWSSAHATPAGCSASASLAVQRGLGVAAEPLLIPPGTDGLLAAAAEASLVVLGLPDRWRRAGLGPVRSALAAGSPAPVLLVRRGLRPGGLAPPASQTRFTWTVGPGSA